MAAKLQDDIIVLVGTNPKTAGAIGNQPLWRFAVQIHDLAFDWTARIVGPEAVDANHDPVRLAFQGALVRHTDIDHHTIGGANDPEGYSRHLPPGIAKDQIQIHQQQRRDDRKDKAPKVPYRDGQYRRCDKKGYALACYEGISSFQFRGFLLSQNAFGLECARLAKG